MSGHSKWHNIQNKKNKMDSKRGKIFTKLGKEIAYAAKIGGGDPDTNAKLRDAIAKAKMNNMPNDTINRSVKKGVGDMDGTNYDEIVYEGYGPGGVAIVVNVLTDNKNRSAANVRHALDKRGGNLGSTGCVSFMFQNKGQFIIEKDDKIDEDTLMMESIEAGAEDFIASDEYYEILTSFENFNDVRDYLEKFNLTYISAEISRIPDNYVEIDEENAIKLSKIIDALEDDDDVQNVYHNAEFPENFDY